MPVKELDVIRLLSDHIVAGLKAGDLGVVVATFLQPEEACEVEFVDEDGATRAQIVLRPNQFELVAT